MSKIIIGDKTKQYGLILPNRKGAAAANVPEVAAPVPRRAASNVFGDSDSDDDSNAPAANDARPLKPFDMRKAALEARMKKQAQNDIDRALKEDPSVYEYDEVYDAMQAQRQRTVQSTRAERQTRQPKYVAALLRQAEERALERELATERLVQREREAEAGAFGDKEAFVTGAYKRKMAALKEAAAALDAADAADQRAAEATGGSGSNMAGFYRHLLHEQTSLCQAAPDTTVAAVSRERSRSPQRRNSGGPSAHSAAPAVNEEEAPVASSPTPATEAVADLENIDDVCVFPKETEETVSRRLAREALLERAAQRRNNEESVAAARARLAARRQQRVGPQLEEDSD